MEHQARAQAEQSDQLRMFLANLEQQYDAQEPEETEFSSDPEPEPLETGRALDDVEAFLREQRGQGGAGATGSWRA